MALAMQDVLGREGIVFRFDARIQRVEPAKGGVRVVTGDAFIDELASRVVYEQHRDSRFQAASFC